MTGRIDFTPEARRQLQQLDDWINDRASSDVARRFILAILEHIKSIAIFPLAGIARDDIRPALRTSTFKKRTLVAYLVDDSAGDVRVTILGVFHGGQDCVSALTGGEPGSDGGVDPED